MIDKLKDIQKEGLAAVATANDADELENVRIKYLGRKGVFSQVMPALAQLSADERPEAGKLANTVKREISEAIKSRSEAVKTAAKKEQKELFDITLPGTRPPIGRRHPITQTLNEIKRIFRILGFEVAYGPEVELEYYNFEALNIPLDHPSRDAFDTFYIKDDVLLRSHTSPVQIRIMEKQQPPLRIIAPGRVFRPDTIDASHSSMFHQVEGLAIDEGITFGDLYAVLHMFVNEFFGKSVEMRFRPSFFPFTEPSAEVDISCVVCGGMGCPVCSQSGWLEVLGAGMVDPNVFECVKYDADKYTGFAFGMGVERLAMLKHGIDDIRLFTQNNLRFLEQF